MNQSVDHYDSIVVGGGLAGLIAARELSQAGLRTLLVEARDRLGGRTNTADFAGQPIETGGTYWDPDREPLAREEFTKYNLPIRYTKDQVAFRTRLNGKTYEEAFPFDQVEDLIRVAYRAIHESHRIDFEKDNWVDDVKDLDIPFSEWLAGIELPRETWEYATAWVEIYGGNLTHNISAADIIGPYIAGMNNSPWSWYAGVSHEIEGGSKLYRQAIIDDSPGLVIKLNTPIVRVEQDANGVQLTSRSGEVFTADDVVWATPLNTWSDVEFTPALCPAKTAAAQEKHVGKQHKLWMRVRNVPVGIYSISHELAFKMLLHHATLDNGETLIFAMTEHTQLNVDDIEAVQRELRKLAPEAEVLETFYENWLDSEFSQGTWMVSRPGFLTNYFGDLDKPEGRLRFAGADVDKRWTGRMVGCISSGKAAAEQIVTSRQGVPVG
ncbi:NAD(P)/FAD-dependent oxidoreductase [Salinibacterium sp. ZJ450]|uniref:flavin monoamine oxidase family protein n=1 Tax=Salinibacterium sp. ZJ450 TaxID=2708338 RepID=UPI00141F89DC|nr:NAD(P)/FAD-dependent oxidoreductase [Salinibacterium sp. ZJ450]